MRYVIGVDGGGTKTVGLLADETGAVVAESRGPGANLATHGELHVEKVFDEIFEALDARHRPPGALCLGLAGVDRLREQDVIRGILRRMGYRVPLCVVHDAMIALAAGSEERIGIAVLAGTGSIVHGADASGATARSGGRGHLVADEGSAYWFGQQALRAVARADDGRGPQTCLRDLLFEALGVSAMGDVVPRLSEEGFSRQRIAALAPLVEKAAGHGDSVAAELIRAGAGELVLAARAVHRRLSFPGPFPVVLVGGAFKACPGMVEPLCRGLDLLHARPVLLQIEPAYGAVRLALDLLKTA
jgi:N-acetylglucosamine kinase-like BadF-type ATPase